ncbi:flagellar basal body L-ring protein FlgH [Methylococcus sp. EFPC2]|uniref:flagellar basal body L-ring protein FlgH n=1 Tax=Methylococcus sp. EFPC2 TaxID=2812648 RepID=UPI0019676BEA|nr:flagellar basal body L-ring protein FlgH [Methylococcus sp. EFPC2]QSA98369.1 flagellar basal body L-ring protein FlgH [Methylococcus sp. EFPC2]
MKRLIPLFLVATQWVGCASLLNPPPTRDPAYAPVRPVEMAQAPMNPGGIYQPGVDMRLFEDVKARRVGDLLTVQLVETTDAKKKADTSANRSATTSVKAPMLMGQEAAEILGYNVKTSLESEHDFEGKGDSNQSNALKGVISVTVVEVLPNGNLRVRGEKRVGLNQGNEYIKLSGIVRPADIDTNNTVLSTKVADATMIYNGEGVVADVNRMGWLQRFFTSFLFPF